jgi:hypothetical protein
MQRHQPMQLEGVVVIVSVNACDLMENTGCRERLSGEKHNPGAARA